MSLVRLMDSLGSLDVLETIARRMYQRTRDPWWKEQVEWIRNQKKREIELSEMMLPLS